jgi:hypothetical protein
MKHIILKLEIYEENVSRTYITYDTRDYYLKIEGRTYAEELKVFSNIVQFIKRISND